MRREASGSAPGSSGDRTSPESSRSRLVRAALLGVAALASGACGHGLYALSINQAATKLEEARELDAEQYAPYEYHMAKEHLAKARTEAAEADYGDAVELSDSAAEYAEKASRLAREAHRGAGR